jgi:hypothetical protein
MRGGNVRRGKEQAEKPAGTIVSRRRRSPLACGMRGFGQNMPFFYMYARSIHYLYTYEQQKNKKNTNGCTAANYHHRNYQAHVSLAIVGEEEHM